MRSSTGVWKKIESPRSPCATAWSHRRYWVARDSSRPISTRSAAISCSVARSPSMTAAGSPGMSRTKTKIRNDAASSVGRKRSEPANQVASHCWTAREIGRRLRRSDSAEGVIRHPAHTFRHDFTSDCAALIQPADWCGNPHGVHRTECAASASRVTHMFRIGAAPRPGHEPGRPQSARKFDLSPDAAGNRSILRAGCPTSTRPRSEARSASSPSIPDSFGDAMLYV